MVWEVIALATPAGASFRFAACEFQAHDQAGLELFHSSKSILKLRQMSWFWRAHTNQDRTAVEGEQLV